MAKVLHQSLVRENAFGGHYVHTACGRDHATSAEGYFNVAGKGERVTCKFCLKMADKKLANA